MIFLFTTLNVGGVISPPLCFGAAAGVGSPNPEEPSTCPRSPRLLSMGSPTRITISMAFSRTGLYLAVRGNCFPVLPVLMLGVLIKYGSAVILPFAVLYLARRHGWGRAAAGVAGAVGVLVLFSLPYIGRDVQLWRSFQGMTSIQNSIPALLFFPFEVLGNLRPSLSATISVVESAIRISFWSGFLVFGLWMGLKRPGCATIHCTSFCAIVSS